MPHSSRERETYSVWIAAHFYWVWGKRSVFSEPDVCYPCKRGAVLNLLAKGGWETLTARACEEWTVWGDLQEGANGWGGRGKQIKNWPPILGWRHSFQPAGKERIFNTTWSLELYYIGFGILLTKLNPCLQLRVILTLLTPEREHDC